MSRHVYLAGPEVFLLNAREIGAHKRAICARHGLVGVFPADVCGGLVRMRATGGHEDANGMAIEPFQMHDNLMLAGGVIASGGCIIAEAAPHADRYTALVAFERCVARVAAELSR